MKAADWIVDFLISKGVTDVFGLPGAVVLEFLYAMDRRKAELTPHLTYHEQGAAFAACGYAQATGNLGVAYATRGPGLTNMVTGIAEAYYDSLPVLYITAHSSALKRTEMRVENNQEIDTVTLVSSITKYAARVDRAEDLPCAVRRAYKEATEGRKGPVFLDIAASVLGGEIEEGPAALPAEVYTPAETAAEEIAARISGAERPVLLIGNGVRQSGMGGIVQELAEKTGVPVLSSRVAQDILPQSPVYFGFVGSHATRHSNFILSKADLIVALGNRMSFPVKSPSFRPVAENTAIIRVDVDEAELLRDVPNARGYAVDLRGLMPALLKREIHYTGREHWLSVCAGLKQSLDQWDKTPAVGVIMRIMEAADRESVFVCDVGNHSFWATNAYAYSGAANRILYSGSFGVLGSALPKTIGAYYGTKSPVICFVGDQGFQMNSQELQFIGQHRLPVAVVVLNNRASAMIREREARKYGTHYVHTTQDSGYGVPNLEAIAEAYRLSYRCVTDPRRVEDDGFTFGELPVLIEIRADEDEFLAPNLPAGKVCQDLVPELPRALYRKLDAMK